ncbi:MAG: sensor histidine kinase KdpD [Verrucomicrobia bacterium]|nr:sensor histidine kinase KdpD [Verrucomicrobiota bacterium]
MDDRETRTPDELLQAITNEEEKRHRGQLKIFLGMSAGVGKTYAMLEEAQELKHAGYEVVIGTVETHGRHETAALLEGLQVIPERQVTYKGKTFKEFDLEKTLSLAPHLVLVDELAHTNIPGSRHLKRWQDVVELLDKGINVYTTLNVQHIDSLKDIVENIANITIRETVPDLVIEMASAIKLIDLSPDELIKRLNQGKVYLGGQSRVAIDNFFQKDRLTALREIIMRYAAEKVDHELHEMSAIVERQKWKPRERLLVAVSHSPHSQKLIRTTKRLAFILNAPWIALHVNDGRELTDKDTHMLDKNIILARDLGAEVITTRAPDIVEAIQKISQQKNITQIIIGRSPQKLFYNILAKPSILDRLAVQSSDTDIHVIRQEQIDKPYEKPKHKILYSQYLIATGSILLLAGVNYLLHPVIGYKVIGFIFLIGILFLSMFLRKGPIYFSSCLYAFIWWYFFIPEKSSFNIPSDEDQMILALYLLTAVVAGTLIDRARVEKEMLSTREATVTSLYDIVSSIATATSAQEATKTVTDSLGKLMHGTFELFVQPPGGKELTCVTSSGLLTDDNEKAAALWSFENEAEAGWSTTNLPASKNLYLPIKGFKHVAGVFAYRPKEDRPLTIEEKNFIHSVGQQLVVSLKHLP